MDDHQMCLACNVNLATSSNGTVPLCDSCAQNVRNPRGIEFQKPPAAEDENPDS